jgi:ABC-type glycerol-3-phosphate transport system substrate-binding protein
MKHMKNKRKLLVSLAALLTLTVTGCSSTDESTAVDRSVLPESIRELSFDKHLEISVGYWNIEDMAKATEPDAMTQYIEELFNISIEPVSVTWSNYKERYQILSATDSLPDVFATLTISSNDNNDSATFSDFIDTGAIRALPEDLEQFPQLREILDSVSYTRYTDGRYYAIPRVSFLDSILGATDAAMLVRRDWMDTLGLSDPESFQDFLDMTVAFAKDDPDGNGQDDTIGYNVNSFSALGKWVMLGIAPECNVYSWTEENGRYVPSWTTDAFKEVVKDYRQLYQMGGLDPDFYTKSPTTVIEDFAAGRLGALEYKSSPASLMELREKWDSMNEKSFEECVDVLPIFPASDGVRYSNSSSVFWSESFISSNVDDEKMERILALFEFLLSDEGQELCHYGLEGIDYEKDEDGTYTCLIDTDGESLSTVLTKKYPSSVLFSGIATWGGSWKDFEVNELNTLRYGSFAISLANQSATWFSENTTQVSRPYAFMSYPKEATEEFSTSNAFDQFVHCIIGDDDPVSMWEAVLEQMKEDGLEEYIQRQNENFENSQMSSSD